MAKRRINPAAVDIIGKIGNLVHYNRNGKPLVRSTPIREEPFTAAELDNQHRFRLAQLFAEAVLTVPRQRARYEQAAAGLDASAQNIAVSDFFHPPIVAEVDLSGYTGRAGEFIRIRAEEGRIGAAEVRVRIAGRAEALLEEGTASMATDGVTWWYAAQRDIDPDQPLWITVTAIDQPGNRTTKTVRHLSGT
jgi:hypothetical protein